MDGPQAEAKRGRRWGAAGRGRLAAGLVFVTVLISAMVCRDALAAAVAAGRGRAPRFLFSLLPAMALTGGGRYVTLGAQLALPALAVLLPLALAAKGVRSRSAGGRRHRRLPFLVLAGVGVLCDAVLYGALGAVAGVGRPAVARPAGAWPGAAASAPALAATAAAGVERIVFSSDRDGAWHLYAMAPDGSRQERLTRSPRVHMQPRIAPDGRRIVFTSAEGDRHTVMLLDLATGEERLVCEGDQASFAGPGGIVFRRSGQVWRRDLASGAESRVSPRAWTRCAYPSAAPGAPDRVAFAARLLAGYNIYFVTGPAEDPPLLVGGQGACDPRWSPSGRKLSYQTEAHIFTADRDGTNAVQATWGAGVQHYAAWAPDERHLAFCQGAGPEGPWQIFSVSLVDDEDPRQLTHEGSNVYPDWGRMTPVRPGE